MPPPGKEPKPAWREMVAPYERAAPGTPTIRSHLRHAPGWLWVQKHGNNWALPLAPYIERYGLDVRLIELQRLRGWDGMIAPTFGRNDEYRFPPIDQVPLGP